MNLAVSPAAVALHGVHVGLVVVGLVTLVWLLLPATLLRGRRLRELRSAATAGDLEGLARRRQLAEMAALPKQVRRTAAVAAVTTLAASGVHVAVSPEHFTEGLRFGVFFVVLAAVQTGWAVAIAWSPTPRVVAAGLVMHAGVTVLWLVTRTTGLPFGLAEVEPAQLPDVAATLLEIVAALACVQLIRIRSRGGARRIGLALPLLAPVRRGL